MALVFEKKDSSKTTDKDPEQSLRHGKPVDDDDLGLSISEDAEEYLKEMFLLMKVQAIPIYAHKRQAESGFSLPEEAVEVAERLIPARREQKSSTCPNKKRLLLAFLFFSSLFALLSLV